MSKSHLERGVAVKLTSPPQGLPAYRLLTGKDDDAFCHRVSEALAMGYELYGSPALAFNGEHCVAAQAIFWGGPRSRDVEMRDT